MESRQRIQRRPHTRGAHTSMFNAVLLMLYVAHLLPQSIAMLASPLDMFTITFFVPFSSSGRNVCAMSAGPMTFA